VADLHEAAHVVVAAILEGEVVGVLAHVAHAQRDRSLEGHLLVALAGAHGEAPAEGLEAGTLQPSPSTWRAAAAKCARKPSTPPKLAAELAQHGELHGRLDALGDDLHLECAGARHDRALEISRLPRRDWAPCYHDGSEETDLRGDDHPELLLRSPGHAGQAARREWTREWWEKGHHGDDLVTSVPVLEELKHVQFPARNECLRLLEPLPLLPVEHAVLDIVEAYLSHRLMPRDPVGDALHLALASYHRCDFLVTWNCRHLANANKFDHIRRVNGLLGLFVPSLVTPLELLGDRDE
jgi:predicted nucleic acid-binding protein